MRRIADGVQENSRISAPPGKYEAVLRFRDTEELKILSWTMFSGR